MTSSSSLYGTSTTQNVSSTNSTSLYGEAGTPVPDASGNVIVRGDLYVLSGNILTTATTGNIFPTNATTLNIGLAATAFNIGAGTGTTTINNNLAVDGTSNFTGTITGTGADFGNITIAVATDNTITTTTGSLVLQSANGEIDTNTTDTLSSNSSTFDLLNSPTSVFAFRNATTLELGEDTGTTGINNNLRIDGDTINLAQGTSFLFDASNNRVNYPQFQSTSGNASGVRILAPNGTTSATASINLFGSDDLDNGSFMGIGVSGSTTSPFALRTGKYTSGTIGTTGKSINFVDNTTVYASVNPAGPTVGTDLTTKTYVDNIIIDNTTYTIDATSTTGGANFNLVGTDATTDTIKFASGTGITVSRTDANTITITNNDPGSTGVTSVTGTANQVIVSSPTGAITLSTPQDIATTSNPTFAGATLGNVTVGVTTDNTINTTSGNLILDGFTNIVEVNANLTVDGTDINLAQGTTFKYDESGSRANRPEFQSTTGNTSGVRVLGPNATTSSSSTFVAVGSNDIDNGQYLAVRASGSTTAPFAIATGVYTGGVLAASGKSISIIDGSTTYATINPSGPTTGTDLTTKTYVDGLIPTVVTYDYNATSTTGGANLNLVGSNATTDTVKLTNGGHITATYASGTAVTLGSDATDANTASTIVARDASGNFSAGTITATLSGTATQVSNSLTAGTHLSGGPFNGSAAVTLTTDATDANTASTIVARDASGNFSAGTVTANSTTIGASAGTVSTSSGNLTVNTVNGTNSGSMVITAGANGAITLAPNGTGSVATTFSNGGNLTNNRNYVFGAIRNATTQTTNGDIWELNTSAAQGAANPYFRGVSLDNSADTTRGPGTLMRSYSGGAVNGSAQRGRVIFEKARGTAASPTAVQSGDFLGSVDVTGYTSTGWINDTVAAVPGFFGFVANENWVSNTALGTAFTLSLAPTSTTISSGANLIACLSVNPQTFASRSDAFTWANGKTGTTQTMSLDVSGNLIVTGDVRINGNDIQGSGGSSAITLTSANTATTVRGDAINLQTSASVGIVGNNISYNRVYGAFQYNTTVTPAAANTPAVFPIGIVDFSNIVSVGSTSRIIIGAAGIYNLQFSVQVENTVNAEHVAYIWLRKNGVDVSGSMGRVTVIKSGSTIAGWNYMISSANTTDYYELAYAVDDTAVIFPTYAATAFGPGTASLITTVTPVGA